MRQITEKLYELANNIFEISRTELWNERIKLFEGSLEIIQEIKNNYYIKEEDYLALRKLTEELIKQGIDKPVTDIKSYKRNNIHELTNQAKEELAEMPSIEEKEPEIKNINDWIKSLKIYKLSGQYLSKNYYQTSYELYKDIRKIVLSKNLHNYKKVYASRVISKLEDKQNDLPENINIKIEDYELSELIRLIKNNPELNYELMPFKYENYLVKERFERIEWQNNLLTLIKK